MFPYGLETEQYLDCFRNGLVSEAGNPIQLRSLAIKSETLSDDQLQAYAEEFPSLNQLKLEKALVTTIPSSLHLEKLTLTDCSEITKLDLLSTLFIRIQVCKGIKSIVAPQAKKIWILCADKLKTLIADKAEHLMLHETGLDEVRLPSAKTLHFITPGDTRVSIAAAKNVTVPEDCVVGPGPRRIERI